jgi:hypothetical protein
MKKVRDPRFSYDDCSGGDFWVMTACHLLIWVVRAGCKEGCDSDLWKGLRIWSQWEQ